MSNNKQSSIEWYAEEIENLQYNPLEKNGYANAKKLLLEKAKALHKKEIIEAYKWGRYDSDKLVMSERFYREQYYEQTFGGNK